MKSSMFLGILTLVGRFASAADVSLSIEPDPYVSSDRATICRVFARNESGRTLDGRAIAFEAQAWEKGAVVMRETGRFAGAIADGDTAETRIGFNGVFGDIRVVAAEGKKAGPAAARRSRKAAGSGSRAKPTRTSSPARASKGSRRGGQK